MFKLLEMRKQQQVRRKEKVAQVAPSTQNHQFVYTPSIQFCAPIMPKYIKNTVTIQTSNTLNSENFQNILLCKKVVFESLYMTGVNDIHRATFMNFNLYETFRRFDKALRAFFKAYVVYFRSTESDVGNPRMLLQEVTNVHMLLCTILQFVRDSKDYDLRKLEHRLNELALYSVSLVYEFKRRNLGSSLPPSSVQGTSVPN